MIRSESSVPDFGVKVKKYMKKKIKYTDEHLGKAEVVRDFLPAPHELVLKEDTLKVTLNLSKSSIEFFKKIAARNGTQYQKVIRNLLDQYAKRYS